MARPADEADTTRRVPTLEQLSGTDPGTCHALEDGRTLLGTGPGADLRFPEDRAPTVAAAHALLEREGDGWRLTAWGDRPVWVNGREVAGASLAPGDLVQLGTGGPLLRFRKRDPAGSDCKSVAQCLADCVDCARLGSGSPLERALRLMERAPRELLTRTSPPVRRTIIGVALLLAALTVATGYLLVRSHRLDDRLTVEESHIRQLAGEATPADIPARFHHPGEAAGRPAPDMIGRASGSVLLLQGSFVFVDSITGERARMSYEEDAAGTSVQGGRTVGTDVEGPPMTSRFTGTGFVVSPSGHILTTRHTVRPGRGMTAVEAMRARGFVPELRRLVGYLPGREDPVPLEVLATSESHDLAAVQGREMIPVRPLSLAETAPDPGEPVYALGYPAGLQALVARSSREFVESIRREGEVGFWDLARRLSARGNIEPLVTRGIVSQLTSAAVVYDAETTDGGSGGPVFGPDGDVVAVTRAVLEGFSGSNLGVPSTAALRFLEEAGIGTSLPDSAGRTASAPEAR